MKIGPLARATGVSRDTVRLYERMGLLTDVTRPHVQNNYKEYGEDNVERIRMIQHMKRLGLTLRECGAAFEALEGEDFDGYQAAFIEQKVAEIDRKIEELLEARRLFVGYGRKGCDSPRPTSS